MHAIVGIHSHTRKLAAAIALACGLSETAVAGSVSFVTNCSDDGSPGTLRSVIAAASDFDTVDLFTQSSCSSITLTMGEIPLPNSVTLLGPAGGTVTIAASPNSRVLHATVNSSGNNSLTLDNVTLVGGRVYTAASPAQGGCILSEGGMVTLESSTLTGCVAAAAGDGARGGAVSAARVHMYQSRIDNSAVYAAGNDGLFAIGGGAAAFYEFRCTESTISGNRALAGAIGEGGGVFIDNGPAYLYRCTVDHNTAQYTGGLLQFSTNGGDRVKITNSTVSSNRAEGADGGIFVTSPATVYNSTIAFNDALVACGGLRGVTQIVLTSSIVANNSSGDPGCVDLYSYGLTTGSNSLVTVVNTAVPMDTIVADPQLTLLADHGGLTFTHGLSLDSPAIDHGDNPVPVTWDQRGPPAFPRVVGNFPDIGAFERQADDDEIFYGGFR